MALIVGTGSLLGVRGGLGTKVGGIVVAPDADVGLDIKFCGVWDLLAVTSGFDGEVESALP